MKTPEEVIDEECGLLHGYPSGGEAIVEALNAAGYALVSKVELQTLRDSFPATEHLDRPPRI